MSENKEDTRTIRIRVPRPWEPGTASTVTMIVVGSSSLYHADQCKQAVKAAVTEWINTTVEGKREWENSCKDFNIGDLIGCRIPEFILIKQKILALEIDSVSDTEMHSWEFDDVLYIEEDERKPN